MYLEKKRHSHSNSKNKQGKNFRQNNAKQPVSNIDSRLFTKKAVPVNVKQYVAQRTIADLPIDQRIIDNLTAKGYSRPTEIQDKTLEFLLENRNLLGIAQTGTGKTGAFLVPVINQLIGKRPAFQVLIVLPTRELAAQVQEEFSGMAKGLGLRSTCFIGGTNVGRDLNALKTPAHIVIGTPGRLTDLARQGVLRLKEFRTLILDEFDRLLEMGFARDIQYIVSSLTNRQQTILFSATEEGQQKNMIRELLHNPAEVRITNGKVTGDHIEQEAVYVQPGENKMQVLIRMIQDKSFQKVIVFADTKRKVSVVRKNLHQSGIRVDEIHGNKSQNYRINALNNFKAGKIQVLIATDVAARGLDISEVTHVINFQPPRDFESYIHRIGRTGRAGKAGKALTFVN